MKNEIKKPRSYNSFALQEIPAELLNKLDLVQKTAGGEKERLLKMYNNNAVTSVVEAVCTALPEFQPKLSDAEWQQCAKTFGAQTLRELSSPDFLEQPMFDTARNELAFLGELFDEMKDNPLMQCAWAYQVLLLANEGRGNLNWLGRNGGRRTDASPELSQRKRADWNKVFSEFGEKSNAEIAEMFGYTLSTVMGERYKYQKRQKAIKLDEMSKTIKKTRKQSVK